MPAGQLAEVPVRERDVEPEDGREDDDRDGEEQRRQQEERPLASLAADHDLCDPEGDRPEDVGVENHAPALEADRNDAHRMKGLKQRHHDEQQGGEPQHQPPRGLATVGKARDGGMLAHAPDVCRGENTAYCRDHRPIDAL